MKTFTDTAGRTWTITLNLGTALAVKEKLGIDLVQPELPYTGDLPSEASAKEGPPLLTLRQLLWMAEGHSRDAWARMSVLCALIGNAHRDPKKGRAFKPSDFDPCLSGRQAFGREPGEAMPAGRSSS